ncbi:hypothetical protein ACJ64_15280 [Bacillus safensis]|nr:hypothetical protein ACJ64_15280 [Bacillus safensis]
MGKLSKLLLVSSVCASVLFSGVGVVKAEEKDPKDIKIGNVKPVWGVGLTGEQLADKLEMESEGLDVTVEKDEDGFTYLLGTYSSERTNKKSSAEVSASSAIGEQTFKVNQNVYYGYTRVTSVKGKINVEYRGTSVKIVSDTLRTITGDGGDVKYTAGGKTKPAKLTYTFSIVRGTSPFNAHPIPFDLWFKISYKGKLTYDQTGTT